MTSSSFPRVRMRRNRQNQWVRNLFAENFLTPHDLILPLFVIEGKNQEEKITNLPDISRYSIDLIVKKAKEAASLGIPALMLFPAIDAKLKNAQGSEALNAKNLICRAIAAIKNAVPQIGVIADVALDPYTTHGHDGLIDKNGYVKNDDTIKILCEQALIQAQAGADFIAPSDMMDGRVGVIRDFLDEHNLVNIGIISYAAKYASNFYGPFRSAVGSHKNLKSDKKNYQMDFHNSNEALREIALDINEGADALIIKPAMTYLDIIARAKNEFKAPLIAYHVSGEYAMLKFAAEKNALDFNCAYYESLIAMKRSGSSAIISYGAIKAAQEFC